MLSQIVYKTAPATTGLQRKNKKFKKMYFVSPTSLPLIQSLPIFSPVNTQDSHFPSSPSFPPSLLHLPPFSCYICSTTISRPGATKCLVSMCILRSMWEATIYIYISTQTHNSHKTTRVLLLHKCRGPEL